MQREKRVARVMRLMGLPKVTHLVMGRSFRDAVELPPFTVA